MGAASLSHREAWGRAHSPPEVLPPTEDKEGPGLKLREDRAALCVPRTLEASGSAGPPTIPLVLNFSKTQRLFGDGRGSQPLSLPTGTRQV